MSFRTRFTLATGAWIAVVAGLLVAVPLAYRSRLPEPMASHWGPGGRPDDSLPFGGLVAVVLVLWAVLAAIGIGSGLTGRRWARRPPRSITGAVLAGGAGFSLGLLGLTVWANLDAGVWSDARGVSWQVVLVIAGSAAIAWLGWRLGGLGPDEPTPVPAGQGQGQAAPIIRLRPGERAVWASTATNRTLLAVGCSLVAASVAFGLLAGLVGLGPLGRPWLVAVLLGLVTLACLAVSSIGVQVNETGMTVAYGVWRWPRRRIRLEKIERGWTEHRMPREVGGWGYRGLPGNATIMVRGGECLVVRYRSGGQLRISIDDAERGAALLNAILERQGGVSPRQ